MAIAGAGLDWSLYCSSHDPELSLQSTLGQTSSAATLLERLNWIKTLVDVGDNGIECKALIKHITEPKARGRAVKRLSKESFSKFVTIEKQVKEKPAQEQADDLQLLVTGEQRTHGRAFNKLTPERQAIYKTIANLAATADGPIKIPLDDFVHEASVHGNDIDIQKLRRLLAISTAPSQADITGLQRVPVPANESSPEPSEIAEDSAEAKATLKKGVWLKPQYQEPLKELVTRLDDSTKPKSLTYFKKRAKQIAGNPELCAQLMAIARRDSMYASRY